MICVPNTHERGVGADGSAAMTQRTEPVGMPARSFLTAARAGMAVLGIGCTVFAAACSPAGDEGDSGQPPDSAAAPTTILAPPETPENRFLSKILHHQLLVWSDDELLAAGRAVCDRVHAGGDGLSWIMNTYGISTEAAANLHVTATGTLGCAQ